MGEFDLNLSTRPFPPYRLKSLLLIAALIGLIGLSAWQGYGFMRYTALAKQIQGEAQNGQIEAAALSRRVAAVDSRLNRPETMAKLNEIEFFNAIIQRKTLSWTRLFATLEDLTPENVHLVGLRPDFEDGSTVKLHMELKVRGIPDLKDFIEALQSNALFSDVIVVSQEKKQAVGQASTDVDVSLNVKYFPEREGQ